MLPENEYPNNLHKKLRQAIASSSLEGMSLPPECIADLDLFYKGKMSEQEAVERFFSRMEINKQS